MKKILLLLFAAVCFVSCQKEITDSVDGGGDNSGGGNNNSNALIGTWTFDSLSSQQHNTSDVNVDGIDNLTVSDFNYTSLGNFGTLTIDDSLFKTVGCTYSISTTSTSSVYQGGVLVDTFSYPYAYYLPPTNSTAKYQLIGTDSVYFPEGNFFSTDTSSTPQPFGLKFKINGNSLVFTQPLNVDTTVVNNGSTLHETSTGTGYLYFHKN